MNELTAYKCRELLIELHADKRNGQISLKQEKYLAALEIALPVLEQQESGADGWIEWRGGSRPVKPSVIVKVRWSDGDIDSGPCRHFFWGKNCGNPIVAYRVVEQERERGEEK